MPEIDRNAPNHLRTKVTQKSAPIPLLGDGTTRPNLRYHHTMKYGPTSRIYGIAPEDETTLEHTAESNSEGTQEDTTLFNTVGWISAGLGAVALGLFLGRELRQRYKFNRRTPYDFYAHSGDEQDVDFGLGI